MRQFLATVAGLAAGVLVIMLVQYIGHRIVKVEINATTPEEFIEALRTYHRKHSFQLPFLMLWEH